MPNPIHGLIKIEQNRVKGEMHSHNPKGGRREGVNEAKKAKDHYIIQHTKRFRSMLNRCTKHHRCQLRIFLSFAATPVLIRMQHYILSPVG
jgi:hypothetical protein